MDDDVKVSYILSASISLTVCKFGVDDAYDDDDIYTFFLCAFILSDDVVNGDADVDNDDDE